MEAVVGAFLRVISTTAAFFWDSLYGLIFGFLISAIAQTTISRPAMERVLGPGLRGILSGAGLGIVASACSYGAAAAARGFYAKGADARAVFAFLISSTNMNVAILIMFWAMLGWKFAFAEFFGGAIIIGIVSIGLSLTARDLLQVSDVLAEATRPARITECLQCGMDGDEEHAVAYEGRTYLFCGARHEAGFRADPGSVIANASADEPTTRGVGALRAPAGWKAVLDTLLADVEMLRFELVVGFVVAGAAAALVPSAWITGALGAALRVPVVGYPLLLLAGLALAVLTFVCSMGNVPIARFLALAGIPLGANTTFIYGDLLIPPLVAIYRKAFPARLVWTFLTLFVLGALCAGAFMDATIGGLFGGAPASTMGSMTFSDRFTLVANVLALVVLAIVALTARAASSSVRPEAPRSLLSSSDASKI